MTIQSVNAMPPISEIRQAKVSAEGAKPVIPGGQKRDAAVKSEEGGSRIESDGFRLGEVVDGLNKVTERMNAELSFSIDPDLNKVIVTVTKPESREVILQIPSKEMVELAKRLKELEEGGEAKGLVIGLKG